jgi:hypothetical protein
MGFFSDLANRPDQPVQDVSNAPMTQEQFVAQNPTYYSQETSNPDYDYMVYQMQQENAAKAAAEAQLQQTDPKAYNAQKAQSLADELFSTFTTNGHVFGDRPNMETENTAALEEIKKVDPNAYYNAQLSLDLRKAGWDAGQGKTNDITNARIQSNIQDALKADFDPNQIQSLVANNYANTAQWHAQNIADRQGQGATLQGIEKVAPAFAAMLTAGALAPAAGALEAGAVGAGVAPEIAGSGFYTGAGTFAGEGLGTAAPLMGPTYGELGITGLPEGAMGPTYGEMGYTGLNQQAAINSANAASQGSQALDALKYGNQARQALGYGNTIAKLLGIGGSASGATGSAVGGATPTASGGNALAGGTSGLSPQQLAKYLTMPAPAQAAAVPYQIKMNQNPFTFDIPGQTQATQGMYDVSGTHPMANALRTA